MELELDIHLTLEGDLDEDCEGEECGHVYKGQISAGSLSICLAVFATSPICNRSRLLWLPNRIGNPRGAYKIQ